MGEDGLKKSVRGSQGQGVSESEREREGESM